MNLRSLIKIDNRFEKSVNLQLDLNAAAKISGYIPTRSSVAILRGYLKESQSYSGSRATILIGPYGKGKSHLLLVLLALLSGQTGKEMDDLVERIVRVDPESAELMKDVRADSRPMLPVIVNAGSSSLNHALIRSLTTALHRFGLDDLVPDNVYSQAIKTIFSWRGDFPETFHRFQELCGGDNGTARLITDLLCYKSAALEKFRELHPQLTSGAAFNPNIDDEVISVFQSVNRKLREQHGYKGIYIVFDEFSKYIEGHAETGFSADMKTLQDMCELANASKEEQLHITCVAHKSIKAYGSSLPKSVLNAFKGVEGRLQEVYFTVTSKNNYELVADAITKSDAFDTWAAGDPVYKDITERSEAVTSFKTLFTPEDFRTIVAKGCYPLTPIAAMLLLGLSEKIAQNERTIFTFVTGKERSGLARLVETAESTDYIGVDSVYDYFVPLFEENSQTEIHHEWLKADYALSKTENPVERAVIKALSVILMLNTPDEIAPNAQYLQLALGISDDDFAAAVSRLEKAALIEYKPRAGAYAFKNNIGVDLDAAISDCIRKRFLHPDYCAELDGVSAFRYIAPKKHNQEACMTRYFAFRFMTAQQFLLLKSQSYLTFSHNPDGAVILILPGEFDRQELVDHLADIPDACAVLLFPEDGEDLEDRVRYLLAVRWLENSTDFIEGNRVILKELQNLEAEVTEEINAIIRQRYFRSSVVCTSEGEFDAAQFGLNRVVSDICDAVYDRTPVINHELINRDNITAAIHKARGTLLEDMLHGRSLEQLYQSGTSAEATICRAVLLNTGLTEIQNEIHAFIHSCAGVRQPFSALMNTLTRAPYGMRKGPVPLLLLDSILKLTDLPVIYLRDQEVAVSAESLVNIVRKPEDYSLLIEEESAKRDQYFTRLQELFSDFDPYCGEIDRRSFPAKIVCLMQSWYRAQPQTSVTFREPDYDGQNMTELTAFRRLLSALNPNPREVVSEKLPQIFGTDDPDLLCEKIASARRDIEGHIDALHSRVGGVIREVFGFDAAANLARSLNEWHAGLPETAKTGLLSTKAGFVRQYAAEVSTNDEHDINAKLARQLTGTYLEDWKDGMADTVFHDQLTAALKEISNLTEDSGASVRTADGISYPVIAEEDLSTSGHFFKNAIDDVLEEYGTLLDSREKAGILMQIIQNLLK